MNDTPPSITGVRVQFLNIILTEEGVGEVEDGRTIVFVPRDQIEMLEFRHGVQAERPAIQAVAGLLFSCLGALGISIFGRGGSFRLGAGCLVFGVLGVLLLWESLRRGYYLQAICRSDARKLVIRGSIKKAGVSDFVQDAAKLGYHLRDCVNKEKALY